MERKQNFEEVLNSNGRLVYTNVGVSMLPLIREGRDIMIIEKRGVSLLKKYDAVLYRRENIKGRGEYVLHRIIKILPDGNFYIVGDNCTNGETVKPSQILGVLTGLIRNGKPVDLTGFRYKAYIALWCAPYRLRFFVLRANRFMFSFLKTTFHKRRIR